MIDPYLKSAEFWLDPVTWLLLIMIALLITAFVIAWWFGLILLALGTGIIGGTLWMLNT